MRRAFADTKWGSKENNHLCISTSSLEIEFLIPVLAEYARRWFRSKQR